MSELIARRALLSSTLCATRHATAERARIITTLNKLTTHHLNEVVCGSHLTPSPWFCVQSHGFAEAVAQTHLADQGFLTFCPLVNEAPPPRRRSARVTVTGRIGVAFPGYLFVTFDPAHDQWRCIVSTEGVKRLFSTAAERPTPIRPGVVEALLRRFGAGLIDHDPTPALAAVGLPFRVTAGPFIGHDGVCHWAQGDRLRMMFDMLGRPTELEFDRREVTPLGRVHQGRAAA